MEDGYFGGIPEEGIEVEDDMRYCEANFYYEIAIKEDSVVQFKNNLIALKCITRRPRFLQ